MTKDEALTEACRRLDLAQGLLITILKVEEKRREECGKSYRSLLEVVGTSLDEIEDLSGVLDTEDLRACLT